MHSRQNYKQKQFKHVENEASHEKFIGWVIKCHFTLMERQHSGGSSNGRSENISKNDMALCVARTNSILKYDNDYIYFMEKRREEMSNEIVANFDRFVQTIPMK